MWTKNSLINTEILYMDLSIRKFNDLTHLKCYTILNEKRDIKHNCIIKEFLLKNDLNEIKWYKCDFRNFYLKTDNFIRLKINCFIGNISNNKIYNLQLYKYGQ